jgi:outer membrane protein X
MKKIIAISSLFVATLFLSNTNAFAQSVGAGLAYGSEVEAIGIQVNGVYGFSDNLRGAADFTLFFPDQPSNGDYSFWTLNANAHYLFMAEGTTNVYGLAGLNYATSEITSNSQFGSFSVSSSEVGLNLGGGAEFGVGFGNIFVEAKYVVSDLDQLVLDGGVRFNL